MGTGPYKLAKVTENETIWVRNDNWWAAEIGLKKLPEPKRLIMSYNGTEEVRLATAIEDDYDGLHDITFWLLPGIGGAESQLDRVPG